MTWSNPEVLIALWIAFLALVCTIVCTTSWLKDRQNKRRLAAWRRKMRRRTK